MIFFANLFRIKSYLNKVPTPRLFINNKATEKHNMPQIIKCIQNPNIAAIEKKASTGGRPYSSVVPRFHWDLETRARVYNFISPEHPVSRIMRGSRRTRYESLEAYRPWEFSRGWNEPLE